MCSGSRVPETSSGSRSISGRCRSCSRLFELSRCDVRGLRRTRYLPDTRYVFPVQVSCSIWFEGRMCSGSSLFERPRNKFGTAWDRAFASVHELLAQLLFSQIEFGDSPDEERRALSLGFTSFKRRLEGMFALVMGFRWAEGP